MVKGSGEAEESNGKDAEVPIKVIPMPRPPPPFPQRLVKKTEMVNTTVWVIMSKMETTTATTTLTGVTMLIETTGMGLMPSSKL